MKIARLMPMLFAGVMLASGLFAQGSSGFDTADPPGSQSGYSATGTNTTGGPSATDMQSPSDPRNTTGRDDNGWQSRMNDTDASTGSDSVSGQDGATVPGGRMGDRDDTRGRRGDMMGRGQMSQRMLAMQPMMMRHMAHMGVSMRPGMGMGMRQGMRMRPSSDAWNGSGSANASGAGAVLRPVKAARLPIRSPGSRTRAGKTSIGRNPTPSRPEVGTSKDGRATARRGIPGTTPEPPLASPARPAATSTPSITGGQRA